MAATKKAPARKARPQVPDWATPVDLRPKQFEVDEGLEIDGTLGAVQKSKDPNKPDYRTIRTEDGLFYLPSHAALLGLLDYPTGTRVYCRFEGGGGKKNDPYQWTVAVAKNGAQDDEDVPF